MKIAVSSQNKVQVTGHAGKTSRFWSYEVNDTKQVERKELIELDKEDILHIRFHESETPFAPHPIFDMDVIITGGAGFGFVNRLAQVGVQVVITDEQDPDTAVEKYLSGTLSQMPPHRHHHQH